MENKNRNVGHRARLRERYGREGADAFQPHELLELFLFDALPRVNTNRTAHALIERFGSLDGVLSASAKELTTVKGIGKKTAEYIAASAEAERRRIEEGFLALPMVTRERASNYLIWHMKRSSADVCFVFTDKKHFILKVCDGTPDVPENAAGVIIGVRGEAVTLRTDEPCLRGITVTDVIKVDGYDAVSIKKETK